MNECENCGNFSDFTAEECYVCSYPFSEDDFDGMTEWEEFEAQWEGLEEWEAMVYDLAQ